MWSYLRKESEAAVAHFRALSSAKSPTDALALQAQEMSRTLNAALSLGQDLAGLTTGAKKKQ
ncbi:phasin family protein [Methylobacterium durans]|uniref:phasin family protein n=1 Tax=Methylobacterium durans TaxID=2202825 RepID=UPI0013A52C14|nr:phasin family protein [Methylobacterium durans]